MTAPILLAARRATSSPEDVGKSGPLGLLLIAAAAHRGRRSWSAR